MPLRREKEKSNGRQERRGAGSENKTIEYTAEYFYNA